MPRKAKGQAAPPEKTFFKGAEAAYDATPPADLNGFDLVVSTPTLKAYKKGNDILLAVRGTKVTDKGDLIADAKIPINKLASSDRYKKDKATLEAILKKYAPQTHDYYLAGHSLGGAIINQLKYDFPFLKDSVQFNPAFQPKDLFYAQGPETKRIYTDKDGLYQLGGRFFRNKKVIPAASSTGVAPIDAISGHVLSNFSSIYGGNRATKNVAEVLLQSGAFGPVPVLPKERKQRRKKLKEIEKTIAEENKAQYEREAEGEDEEGSVIGGTRSPLAKALARRKYLETMIPNLEAQYVNTENEIARLTTEIQALRNAIQSTYNVTIHLQQNQEGHIITPFDIDPNEPLSDERQRALYQDTDVLVSVILPYNEQKKLLDATSKKHQRFSRELETARDVIRGSARPRPSDDEEAVLNQRLDAIAERFAATPMANVDPNNLQAMIVVMRNLPPRISSKVVEFFSRGALPHAENDNHLIRYLYEDTPESQDYALAHFFENLKLKSEPVPSITAYVNRVRSKIPNWLSNAPTRASSPTEEITGGISPLHKLIMRRKYLTEEIPNLQRHYQELRQIREEDDARIMNLANQVGNHYNFTIDIQLSPEQLITEFVYTPDTDEPLSPENARALRREQKRLSKMADRRNEGKTLEDATLQRHREFSDELRDIESNLRKEMRGSGAKGGVRGRPVEESLGISPPPSPPPPPELPPTRPSSPVVSNDELLRRFELVENAALDPLPDDIQPELNAVRRIRAGETYKRLIYALRVEQYNQALALYHHLRTMGNVTPEEIRNTFIERAFFDPTQDTTPIVHEAPRPSFLDDEPSGSGKSSGFIKMLYAKRVLKKTAADYGPGARDKSAPKKFKRQYIRAPSKQLLAKFPPPPEYSPPKSAKKPAAPPNPLNRPFSKEERAKLSPAELEEVRRLERERKQKSVENQREKAWSSLSEAEKKVLLEEAGSLRAKTEGTKARALIKAKNLAVKQAKKGAKGSGVVQDLLQKFGNTELGQKIGRSVLKGAYSVFKKLRGKGGAANLPPFDLTTPEGKQALEDFIGSHKDVASAEVRADSEAFTSALQTIRKINREITNFNLDDARRWKEWGNNVLVEFGDKIIDVLGVGAGFVLANYGVPPMASKLAITAVKNILKGFKPQTIEDFVGAMKQMRAQLLEGKPHWKAKYSELVTEGLKKMMTKIEMSTTGDEMSGADPLASLRRRKAKAKGGVQFVSQNTLFQRLQDSFDLIARDNLEERFFNNTLPRRIKVRIDNLKTRNVSLSTAYREILDYLHQEPTYSINMDLAGTFLYIAHILDESTYHIMETLRAMIAPSTTTPDPSRPSSPEGEDPTGSSLRRRKVKGKGQCASKPKATLTTKKRTKKSKSDTQEVVVPQLNPMRLTSKPTKAEKVLGIEGKGKKEKKFLKEYSKAFPDDDVALENVARVVKGHTKDWIVESPTPIRDVPSRTSARSQEFAIAPNINRFRPITPKAKKSVSFKGGKRVVKKKSK